MLDQLFRRHGLQLIQSAAKRIAQERGRCVGIGMRALGRLRDDAIDQAEVQEVGRCQFERGGCLLGAGGVTLNNGGAAFRRNHAVNGVLEQIYPIADSQRERSAATAFADADARSVDGSRRKAAR